MIKSQRMRWAEHVAQIWERRSTYRLFGGYSQKENDHLEDQDIGGWIILGWILER
jgi:hypothetical protein